MDGLTLNTVPAFVQPARLGGMARQKAEGDRYFVRLGKEAKRKLDFLTVAADDDSTEAYAGRLLTDAIEREWAHFDAKKAVAAASKPPKKQ